MQLHDELAEVAELHVGHSPDVTGKGEYTFNSLATICALIELQCCEFLFL